MHPALGGTAGSRYCDGSCDGRDPPASLLPRNESLPHDPTTYAMCYASYATGPKRALLGSARPPPGPLRGPAGARWSPLEPAGARWSLGAPSAASPGHPSISSLSVARSTADGLRNVVRKWTRTSQTLDMHRATRIRSAAAGCQSPPNGSRGALMMP
ncbi:hypothetical protein TARUN_10021 [Trichoderma arundinaceum]|uniref:Uncharacterized protein n=1 Tax=Trichoderma arundinaceum TaxID=490622 RepID=A0A395N8N7_TRIAR|nr:hypothetical protein TARUN_10021 [Trichoderma arundinaceum]